MDPRQVIHRLAQVRLEYYRKLGSRETVGQGWANRAKGVKQAALEIIQQT